MTVLIVDDNMDARETLADVLRLEGDTVETAADGAAAIAMLREASEPPRAVLVGNSLGPPVTRDALVAFIQSAPHLQGVAIVMLTASNEWSDVVHPQALATKSWWPWRWP